MELTKREVDYLKAIAQLTSKCEIVKISEIASHLKLSKPTVIEAMRKLEMKGFVTYIPKLGVKLTEKGILTLVNIKRKHRILETLFVEVLKLPIEEACREASRIELYVSEELIDNICKFLGHPNFCPHGYPIPHKLTCCGRR